MVTFDNRGRCGNFLFEAAAAMAYAWKHGLEFTVPATTKDARWNPIFLPHLVNPDYDPSLPITTLREVAHTFQALPFKEEWRHRNIVLHGYWQTEKYFLEYRDRILETFGFPWEPWQGIVSVHVRRGDYLTLKEKHPEVTVDWYLEAMSKFEGFNFQFFSDDIPWCRSTFGHRNDVSFSTGTSEIEDLISGSCCEHHVCSASTFSWWQAWLGRNPNKRIVIPKNWFMPGRREDTRDIVPASWEKL